ncbi:N-acetyltransferase [Jeotgalibacillus proteolyticus]|uniref:N-acetyltransferase n=1 Tax=Jeotgalibacillus proteolyticus TaxID=2082395 RepID=A0A2S5GCT1_9BACL|nr:N-acetyltransferase [Jeotgalibacillus proteolyticus]PPA70721.1 N-acetyltransferase [Jeotgalibacillus proteolyticus]
MHLFQGEVIHLSTEKTKPFTVRPLNDQDKELFQFLQEEIVEGLEDQDTLQPLTEDEIIYIFEGGGLMIGAFVEDELIAARALLYPGDDEENIGHDLDLPFKEQMKVVHQEISLVRSDYRGNDLQKTMAKVLMQQLRHSTDYFTHLCCTVSPKNIASIKDKFSQGLMIVKVKEKYEGSLRYIFYKHLTNKFPVDDTSFVHIRLDKTLRHRDFLENGYVGVGLSQTELGDWIVFARLSEEN